MVFIWDLNPVAFTIPYLGQPVRWYGLLYIVSFFLVLSWGWSQQKTLKTQDQAPGFKDYAAWEHFALLTFLVGIAGGRIGHFLFFNPTPLRQDWTEIFRIWEGGMAIQGGIIAACVFGILYSHQKHYHLRAIGDMVAAPIILALGVGRIGNLINGELAGKPTDQTWGLIYPHLDPLVRHIPPLYECVSYLLLSLGLYILFKYRKKSPGYLFPLGILGVCISRFFIEYTKVSPLDWGPFTSGQGLCIVLSIISLGIIIGLNRHERKIT